MVRAFVAGAAGAGQPEAPAPNQEPPVGLDWDMWCGPAPYHPYNPALHPKKWRQFLDYANGQIGDWVHWTDQIYWILGDDKHPKSISAVGGVYVREPSPADAPPNTAVPDAPDTLDVHWEFDDCVATWEHHQYGGNNQEKARIGCYFFGSKGVCHVGWGEGWTFYPLNKNEPEIHEDPQLHTGRSECARTVGQLRRRHREQQAPHLRHRNRPPLHDLEPSRHAVMETRPQYRMGR